MAALMRQMPVLILRSHSFGASYGTYLQRFVYSSQSSSSDQTYSSLIVTNGSIYYQIKAKSNILQLQFSWMLLFNRVFFSTTKNYVNALKVRSRLADFFKHIHPDQMVQAPTKIKDENLQSLKNFNSYLDAINQQKPIEGKLLKFYISEKTNHKSRKFFSFNLELPDINSQQSSLNEEKATKLIDDIVNALNSKFKESRNILDNKKKDKIVVQPEIKVETEEEKVQRQQQSIGPFKNMQKSWSVEEERLRKAINAKYMENQRQNLKLKLRKNISFANTSTNKPMMWSRIMANQSGVYDDYQKILNHLIDPKLIFFSEDIGVAQIEQFKKKLLPGEADRLGIKATQAILDVCEQMEEITPPICLFVTNNYSATQIPGFFSVPFNFKPNEMFEQWKHCREIILTERQKYIQMYDFFQDLQKQLQKYHNFVVNIPNFRNNQDVSSKVQVLQRLKKHSLAKMAELHILEKDQMRILCHQFQLDTDKTVHKVSSALFLIANFQEEHLKEVIEKVNLQRGKVMEMV